MFYTTFFEVFLSSLLQSKTVGAFISLFSGSYPETTANIPHYLLIRNPSTKPNKRLIEDRKTLGQPRRAGSLSLE